MRSSKPAAGHDGHVVLWPCGDMKSALRICESFKHPINGLSNFTTRRFMNGVGISAFNDTRNSQTPLSGTNHVTQCCDAVCPVYACFFFHDISIRIEGSENVRNVEVT